MKGKLIAEGWNMFRLMDFCYNAKPRLTNENSILEFDVKTDEWRLYEKLTDKTENTLNNSKE